MARQGDKRREHILWIAKDVFPEMDRDVYFYGSQMSGFDGHVLARAWWISVFPGLAIMMTTMSINFIGDCLRQVLDPRLKIQ